MNMTGLWDSVKQRMDALATGWASYTALGSFFLYLMGYLAIRFHLTALGIGTDLAVLDERYLFAGAKFVVYLFSTVPLVLLFAIALLLVYGIVYLLYRLIKKLVPAVGAISRPWNGFLKWWATPTKIVVTGIVFSVLMIQIVMRKCYSFSNLLLESCLPKTRIGLERLLLDEGTERRALYFAAILAATALACWLLFYARSKLIPTLEQSAGFKFLFSLLIFLILVQVLLLPVNYGVIIMDKSLPKVAHLGDLTALQQGEEAWLVWEGTHGVTYLIENTATQGEAGQVVKKRSLVTLQQKEVKRTEIMRYDQIFRRIFGP